MNKVTIYTENLPNTYKIVAKHFDCATIQNAMGLWKGKLESSLVIILFDFTEEKVYDLVADIKKINNQESVLVEWSYNYNSKSPMRELV